MKVLNNIGLGLFILSIVSVILWSPIQYSIPHDLNMMDKMPKSKSEIWNKSKNMPYKGQLEPMLDIKYDTNDEIKDSYKSNIIQNYDTIANMLKQKTYETKNEALKSIGETNMEYTSLKDTTSSQARNYIKDEATHVIHTAEAAVETSDAWIANHSHGIFDKSSIITNNAESAIDEVVHKTHNALDQALKETLQKQTNLKKSIEYSIGNISNVVGLLEDNICKQDENESNLIHNNLQLFATSDTHNHVENASNVVHNNLQLLGVDNSDDFITENTHRNPQELGEQCAQLSKDTGLGLIERSFIEVNNLWSTLMGDGRKPINEKDNGYKESFNKKYERQYNQHGGYQNKRCYEDTMKHHYDIKDQHKRPPQDDSYDNNNSGSMKDQKEIYSNDLQNKNNNAHNKIKPNVYHDSVRRYNDNTYNNVKDKTEQYYKGFRNKFEAARGDNEDGINYDGVRGTYKGIHEVYEGAHGAYTGAKIGANIGNAIGKKYDGVHGAYEGIKVGANAGAKVGYRVGKQFKKGKDAAQHHYKDAIHKTHEGYASTVNAVNNNLQRMEEKLHSKEPNIVVHDDNDNDNDEEFDEFSDNTRERRTDMTFQYK